MALRIEKRTQITAGLIALLLAPAAFSQQQFRYQVWHGHTRPPHPVWHNTLPSFKKKFGNPGTLIITAQGVSFEESYAGKKKPKHPHAWTWAYQDIQQLEIAPREIRVLTYKDNKWRLGADREYRFDLLPSDASFADAYQLLKDRLDQRFVAALADKEILALWEIPVKLQGRIQGSEGVLQVGAGRIVYSTDKKDTSRTWRYEDIENISSSGPFQLTLTTYERAITHYGNLKGFNFQLKERLDEKKYNALWRRLNQEKGLELLTAYKEAQDKETQAMLSAGQSKSKEPQKEIERQ